MHFPPNKPSAPAVRRSPWEQYASENEQEFRAFLDYLESPLPRRVMALRGAYPTAQLGTWSKKNRWGERARAWDEHLAAIELKELETAAANKGRTRAVQLGNALDNLATYLERETAKMVRDSRGSVHTVMKPNEVSRMVEVADKITRLDAGQATSILRSDVDLSKLTPEQLEKLDELLSEAVPDGDDDEEG